VKQFYVAMNHNIMDDIHEDIEQRLVAKSLIRTHAFQFLLIYAFLCILCFEFFFKLFVALFDMECVDIDVAHVDGVIFGKFNGF